MVKKVRAQSASKPRNEDLIKGATVKYETLVSRLTNLKRLVRQQQYPFEVHFFEEVYSLMPTLEESGASSSDINKIRGILDYVGALSTSSMRHQLSVYIIKVITVRFLSEFSSLLLDVTRDSSNVQSRVPTFISFWSSLPNIPFTDFINSYFDVDSLEFFRITYQSTMNLKLSIGYGQAANDQNG